MWIYEKKLQYPVKIRSKDLTMGKYIMAQLGGPDGELSTALTYLNQRYTMPTGKGKALLTDIGTEELAHVEIIQTMIVQLLKGATPDELNAAGLGAYYAIRDHAVYPADSFGNPWTASYISSTGDPIADIHNDMALEQKSRAAYERIMSLTNDPDLIDPLRFLREREVVHYQRFGELLTSIQ